MLLSPLVWDVSTNDASSECSLELMNTPLYSDATMSLQSWLMRTSDRTNHLWFFRSRWQTSQWNLWWLEIALCLENSSYSLDAFLVYITSIVNRIHSRGIILFKKASFLILQHQEKKNMEIDVVDVRCGRAVLLTKSLELKCIWQKQPFIGVLKKRYAEICSNFTGEHSEILKSHFGMSVLL